MKSTIVRFCIWFLTLILYLQPGFSTAFAESGPQDSRPLTLSDAIKTAIRQNPAVKAARHQMDASESQVVQAQSGLFPQIYFSETFNRTNNPMWAFGTKLNHGNITREDFDPDKLNSPDAINNFATAVSVNWAVFTGGQIRVGLKQAKQNQAAMSLMLKRTRQEVIAKTAMAYVELLLARENLSVVKQAFETARVHLKMVRSRFESGFVVKSDLLRAKVRLAELEQQSLQAKSRAEVAQAMLNAVMGVFEDIIIDPVSPLDRCTQTEGPVNEWINTALSDRPDLLCLHYQENIAQEEITKAKAAHFPNLSLMGTYEIDSEDFSDTEDNYTLGAVVRLNLFSGNRISGKIKEALAILRQTQAMKKTMELSVRIETKRAFLQAQSAWKQIQVARTAVTQAEEGLRIVRNRYKNGLLTIVSLLDAEVALQEARTRLFRSMHDYKAARINLALAVGTIDTDFK